ncbi:MAG: MarR family transcriptional regulator [Pseudomonadota bacterium]
MAIIVEKNLAAAILLESMIRSAYADTRSSDVQPLQWSIMRYLAQANGKPCTLHSIARYVGVTAAPASRAVETLHKRGLISKRRDPDNARAVAVTITSPGIALLASDPLLPIAVRLQKLPDHTNSEFIRILRNLALASDES